mmetsp:Transcript_18149/g.38073  ORF Transcript_18149/g.38073 Transcript_18149/m.38073 type:complete len:432 (-) Transcript_18149:117-1412(-)
MIFFTCFGKLTFSLSLIATIATAWTSHHIPVSSPRLNSLSARPSRGVECSVGNLSTERREFLQNVATKTAAISLLLGGSTVTPVLKLDSIGVANAASTLADAGSTYSKLYEPPAHSMDGKLVVITGGNTGLGLESAKRLAAAGATVVFTSRDEGKGQKALDEIDAYLKEKSSDGDSPQGKAIVVMLDLCDLDNIKSFDSRFENAVGKDAKIDVLMNNAGVMAIPDRRLTKDGYEKTFQTNHLGHFALTSTLLPYLSPDARIINVSSMGYLFASKGLDVDNLNGEKEYGPWSSYGLSKLENILFTNELQKRASQSDKWSSLAVFSLHPGAVQTDLARYLIGEEKFQSMKENGFSSWSDKVLMETLAKFVKTVQEGASTQVYLAASKGIKAVDDGKFFVDGKATPVQPFASDDEKAKELWTISEKLSGVKFEL